jgi:O-acetyl-ADP-ribose deacetylase (regulator of RNase III)
MDRLGLLRGDITKLEVDAIVNAANTTLLGGGGVDGAIHRAAGPQLLAECRTLGGCSTGEAKLTRGYNLPARFVIHTVGPVWRGGTSGEPELLANCYRNSLALAAAQGIKTMAFPAISCGAYGYPVADAARIAVETSRDVLDDQGLDVSVLFVVASEQILGVYQEVLDAIAPPREKN